MSIKSVFFCINKIENNIFYSNNLKSIKKCSVIRLIYLFFEIRKVRTDEQDMPYKITLKRCGGSSKVVVF